MIKHKFIVSLEVSFDLHDASDLVNAAEDLDGFIEDIRGGCACEVTDMVIKRQDIYYQGKAQ